MRNESEDFEFELSKLSSSRGNNQFIDFTKWILKWTLLIMLGSVFLLTVFVGGVIGLGWYNSGRHLAVLEAVVVYGNGFTDQSEWGDSCPEEFPILIGVSNRSGKTVESVKISVEGRLPGRSTNILNYSSQWITQDFIVPPSGGRGSCYKLTVKPEFENNPELAHVVYTASITSATFAE